MIRSENMRLCQTDLIYRRCADVSRPKNLLIKLLLHGCVWERVEVSVSVSECVCVCVCERENVWIETQSGLFPPLSRCFWIYILIWSETKMIRRKLWVEITHKTSRSEQTLSKLTMTLKKVWQKSSVHLMIDLKTCCNKTQIPKYKYHLLHSFVFT